jgi:thiol-disulfide isomerase/thioredoxin
MDAEHASVDSRIDDEVVQDTDASSADVDHPDDSGQPHHGHAEHSSHHGEDSDASHGHARHSDSNHGHANHGSSHVSEDTAPFAHGNSGEGHAHSAHGKPAHNHGTSTDTKDDHGTIEKVKMVAIGEKVPDFEVTIDGKTWKLSELQKNKAMTEDGTLVLTFWCSFCHSCRHVEQSLDVLAKKYKQKVGIIALDASAGETTEGVAEFAKKKGLTLPIALDESGTTADIFGTRVTTTTVVIDKNGVLQYRGQFSDRQHDFAADALQAVLAGKDVPLRETRQKG